MNAPHAYLAAATLDDAHDVARRTSARKPAAALTLHDRLSRLTYEEACRLLGPRGATLIGRSLPSVIGRVEPIALDATRVVVSIPRVDADDAVVTIALTDDGARRLRWRCSACTFPCAHAGAVFTIMLEDKMALGLAAPPPYPDDGPGDPVDRALAARLERARTEPLTVRAASADTPWTDYTVTSAASGQTYRVALRGESRGDSYCSCPDFRANTLGTCKHVLHLLDHVRARFSPAARRARPLRSHVAVHLRHGDELELRVATPPALPLAVRDALAPVLDRAITDVADLARRLGVVERLGQPVTVYPDAGEHIARAAFRRQVAPLVTAIRADPAGHPLRRELLRAELLPYQLDGIAFAVGAGRAVLADDMGLGKTIQAIGVAELLAREAGIAKVLVVCPASVKAQWCGEVQRFSTRTCQVVLGGAAVRADQYASDTFFSICNYEQVLRDLRLIERAPWDLIVLDEGQRIKNWQARTTAAVKRLRSRFALVLSGTPLENRLDELFSVIEVVDERCLGPAFRFFDRHRVIDDEGRFHGYQRLDELRARLAPVLLRRTRAAVAQELPPCTTEIVRVAPTAEQLQIHDANMNVVAQIARRPYLTEMDLLRLRKALLMCRMVANSTFLVDKRGPASSSKLPAVVELLVRASAAGRKLVVFSEWTTMLDLIEDGLRSHGLRWVRLDGAVAQRRRQQLVDRFQRDPACPIFLTTNAGSTGLNLQAADTVVNVDLPWNPAILAQRIGRAHRLGQRRPVHAYVLVSTGTIEDRLLATLSAKHALARATLDPDSTIDALAVPGAMDDLRRRLEVLVGARPIAPVDERAQRRATAAVHAAAADRRQRVAAASADLATAAARLLGELRPAAVLADASPRPALHAAPPFDSLLPAAPPFDGLLPARLGDAAPAAPAHPAAAGDPGLAITPHDRVILTQLAGLLAAVLDRAPPTSAPPPDASSGPERH